MTNGVRRIDGVLFVQAGRFMEHHFDRKLARGDFRVYAVVFEKRREVFEVTAKPERIELLHEFPYTDGSQGRMVTFIQPVNWLAVVPKFTNQKIDAMGRVIPL